MCARGTVTPLYLNSGLWYNTAKIACRGFPPQAGARDPMKQILLIEDDAGLNLGLSRALQQDDTRVLSCRNLQSAREQLSCQVPDLVLLDLSLPDGSGLTLLEEIRARFARLPVILLTANDTDRDIVQGLEAGADDYITKPFSLAVLRARVRTQLRRFAPAESAAVEIGPYSFDFDALHFTANGVPVELSKTEQKLLRLLVENRGRTMSRATLTDRIWTDGAAFVEENALSVTVKRLRDKLGAQSCIKTIYGVGYSWVTDHE